MVCSAWMKLFKFHGYEWSCKGEREWYYMWDRRWRVVFEVFTDLWRGSELNGRCSFLSEWLLCVLNYF